jgi:queuosine precursor transporter
VPASPWFSAVVALFVTTLLISNVISVKLFVLGPLVLPAGMVIFPVSYIVGDVLTEVYGYARARQVIWLGFACNLIAVVVIQIALALPPAPFWTPNQAAYETILGFTPRLLVASFIAYLVGEFANSAVLARMKIVTRGRYLWTRTIGSTVVGEGLDSAVFITIAFFGIMPHVELLPAIVTQWLFKTAYETLATPITYLVVNFLKRVEGVDVYDDATPLNPFLVSEP